VDGVCIAPSATEEAIDETVEDEAVAHEAVDDRLDHEDVAHEEQKEQVRDREVDLGAMVPADSRVEYRVPQVKGRQARTHEEDRLARYIQVVLPEGEDPTELMSLLRDLECFEDVSESPEVSLPSEPGLPPFGAPAAPPSPPAELPE
jgi:hypothetical protein